jgi:hypothetical protein
MHNKTITDLEDQDVRLQLDHKLYPAQQIEQGGSGVASVVDPFFSALKNKKKSKNKNCKINV